MCTDKLYFMPHHHNARQNHNIKVPNKFLKYVIKFKYMGTTVTNQIFMKKLRAQRLKCIKL